MTRGRAGSWVIAASLVTIALLTLLPTGTDPSRLLSCVVCGDRGSVDVLLNVLLFIPLGTGLRMKGARIPEALVVSLILSASIELAQLLAVTGRTASPGDVLTNTVGGTLGALLAPAWRTLARPSPRSAFALGVAGGLLWVASLAFTGWAMQPQLWSTRLFAQIRPAIPRLADRYPGEVQGMFVNGEAMAGGWITDEARRASRLDQLPGEVAATLRWRPPARSAIIVRVVDERRRTRLELRAIGADLVFEPSLRASSLRLSRPAIRLPSAFSGVDGSELLRATGSLRDGEMHVTLAGGASAARADAKLRATLGWMLLLPMSYALGPEASWLTALWIVLLVFPWSYWLGAAMRGPHARGAAAAGVAMIVIGLATVPALFVLPVSAPVEWMIAIGALTLGASCGRAVASVGRPLPVARAQPVAPLLHARRPSRGLARKSSE